jgi:hypothetical protein
MYKKAESMVMKAQGESRGKLNERQGGLSGSSPLRSGVSRDSQMGRLDCVSSGQRQTQGDYQDQVHSDHMLLG